MGRSILLVDIEGADIIATVGEFEKYLCECWGAGLGEDVRP